MREYIKLKIAKNARSMVFTPALVTGMPFSGDSFKSICPRILGPSFFLYDFWVYALY